MVAANKGQPETVGSRLLAAVAPFVRCRSCCAPTATTLATSEKLYERKTSIPATTSRGFSTKTRTRVVSETVGHPDLCYGNVLCSGETGVAQTGTLYYAIGSETQDSEHAFVARGIAIRVSRTSLIKQTCILMREQRRASRRMRASETETGCGELVP